MGNLWYLVLVIALSVLGGAAVWAFRNRPRSMQASMDAFHRELDAIAPRRTGSEPTTRVGEGAAHLDDVHPIPLRRRSDPSVAGGLPPTGAAVAGGRTPEQDRDRSARPLGRRPGRPIA